MMPEETGAFCTERMLATKATSLDFLVTSVYTDGVIFQLSWILKRYGDVIPGHLSTKWFTLHRKIPIVRCNIN